MKCLNPVRLTKNLDKKKFPYGLFVPCGQCMNCRLQKREEWTMRILHESSYWEKCLFLTLTYSDDYLPENSSLKKSDLQKFFKRLRKRLNGKEIKYFACGEYGEESGRPHYHCLIFGIDYLDLVDRLIIKDSWTLCDWSMLGSKPFGDITTQSIRYTVSYIEKEILGKQREVAYDGIEPPFRLVSKGIGKKYAKEHKKEFEEKGSITMQGFKKSLPRYYTTINNIERCGLQEYAEQSEIEIVDSVIGIKATRDEVYMTMAKDEVLKVEDAIQKSNIQHDLNLKKRIDINSRRNNKNI